MGAERILIAGGGMAGSLLALVLGRTGREVVVCDPRRAPSPMFRNEKLGTEQIVLLRKLGALACFERACWPAAGDPRAYPDGARPSLTDCGAPHEDWLASVRDAWPETVRFVEDSVERLETSDALQLMVTRGGERIPGRLAVLATGRLPALRDALGIRSRVVSAGHSVCLGFSVEADRPVASQVIPAPFGSRLGYVSIFPMPGGQVRINLFSYRPLDDPWTRRMSRDPLGGLFELIPDAAGPLDGARVIRRCEARGTDLYACRNPAQPGVVLVGDAFHAPCPASGTGMLRILNDVDALANRHIPAWLATPGMGREKIARFYADAEKRRVDRASLRRSRRGRGMAVETGPYWAVRRAVRDAARALH